MELPVLSVDVSHAGQCPHFLGVRADPFVAPCGKSIENQNTEKYTFSKMLYQFWRGDDPNKVNQTIVSWWITV